MANAAGDLDVKIKRIRVFADDMEIVFPPQAMPIGDDDDGDDDDSSEGSNP
jgi:hypothetical protein